MTYFGTDGIRGKAYDSLPLLRAYQLGVAIQEVYHGDKVVIGYDTRESSIDFLNALLQGLDGMEVIVGGMLPTPVIAYYSQVHHMIGIMITASHNPYEDNGLKVFEYGFKVLEQSKLKLEAIMQKISSYEPLNIQYQVTHIESEYIDFTQQLFPHLSFTEYSIDNAHGATSIIAQMLFPAKHYFCEPNGVNINASCGATHMDAIKKVKQTPVAFSFDGDGDRMLMVIDDEIIFGDQVLYVFAKDYLLKQKEISVALSVMTNPGVIQAFESLNIHLFETPVGDAHLFDAIANHGITMGAEASGHFMMTYRDDKTSALIGDGMLAAMYMIDIFSRYGLDTVKSWLKEIKMMPMKTKNINISKDVLDKPEVKSCIESLTKTVNHPYKVIVRPSGTEPKIRLTVSLETLDEVDAMLEQLSACIERG